MTASLTQDNQVAQVANCSERQTGELTKDEVAAHFLVTKRTITDWMRQRGLPHVKISRRTVRFKLSAVEEWSQRFSSARQKPAGW
jgi:excisionase family DNA binding protein